MDAIVNKSYLSFAVQMNVNNLLPCFWLSMCRTRLYTTFLFVFRE